MKIKDRQVDEIRSIDRKKITQVRLNKIDMYMTSKKDKIGLDKIR